MARFNLLEEPWIMVLTDDKGTLEEVSLLQLFKNAPQYLQLAGEMEMQNFAIMRLLLAVLHTVFSRFDSKGDPYPYFKLDEKYLQMNELDEDDLEEYQEDLLLTWQELWEENFFPNIVVDYLLRWKDRFYLFDDKYPFYQVTGEEQLKRPIKAGRGVNPSKVSPKTFNRKISESENKIAFFSPRYSAQNNKNRMDEAELARWLILFQGVVGTGDKARYENFSGKNSKGWIYDIGGIALRGENLFETLLLNLIFVHPEENYQCKIQKPCWEQTGDSIISKLISGSPVNNLAEIYTNWSRAIFIEPESKIDNNFVLNIVKMPEIEHRNQFLEPMTLWRYRTQGQNKDNFTPQKHNIDASLWRSFGSVFLSTEKNEKKPGVIEWFYEIKKIIKQAYVVIESYGMESDGNATSWLPVEEYFDTLDINEYIIEDVRADGWVVRINLEVELTKEIVEKTFSKFANNVKNIRNISNDDFVKKAKLLLYDEIDQPFRDWLCSLSVQHDKEARIGEWRKIFRKIALEEANSLVRSASGRDFKGTFKDGKVNNIAIAYNQFDYWLNKNLGFIKSKKGE